MEVVSPDRVEAPSAVGLPPDHARQIAMVFRDEKHRAARNGGTDPARKLTKEMARTIVDERVRSVETEPVDVVLVYPVQRILDEEGAHHVAVLAVEIDGGTPWGVVALGKIVGAERTQVGAVRSQMVVDNVEQHPQAEPVCAIDEPPQVVRPAVTPRRRKQGDAVIPPIALAGKVGHRHQL
jgi:hypothetical protein